MQRGPRGYDPGLWSVVFPLGMYTAATHNYATVARLPFLDSITQPLFWIALLAWTMTFIGMWVQLLSHTPWRSSTKSSPGTPP
jgi:tellurite resistance protein TehA-like permease